MAQALLPLKDLVQAKTRLAGLLRPSERRALAQAMAEDVLAVLAGHGDITSITLVSDDPGADLLARKYGAQCWPERMLSGRGLNGLMQCASTRLLAACDASQPLIVLHADLPLLTCDDVSAVLSAYETYGGLIVGSDRPGTGTNLLAFGATGIPRFCFGAGSCAEHVASAGKLGLPVSMLHRDGIAVDVDNPRDLQWVMGRLQQHAHGLTAALLLDTPLGARVALALATLPVCAGSDKRNRGSLS